MTRMVPGGTDLTCRVDNLTVVLLTSMGDGLVRSDLNGGVVILGIGRWSDELLCQRCLACLVSLKVDVTWR
jgi:hypothetical protein